MQMSLRLPDDLAEEVRARASQCGQSLNGYITLVLRAVVDPSLAGSEASQLRERLARAGILEEAGKPARRRPGKTAVARARASAGKGTSLSEIAADARR